VEDGTDDEVEVGRDLVDPAAGFLRHAA
jgi:hypothetical protein